MNVNREEAVYVVHDNFKEFNNLSIWSVGENDIPFYDESKEDDLSDSRLSICIKDCPKTALYY